MTTKIELIKEFISNTDDFWNDGLLRNIDSKHKNILNQFKKKYKRNLDLFAKDIVDWSGQGDQGVPFQLNKSSLKYYGIKKTLIKTLKSFIKYFRNENLDADSFLDDLEMIKLVKGDSFFKNLDLSKRDDKPEVFFHKNGIKSNYRWNRYVYLAARISNLNLLTSKNKNWLDIGSYYGGLQSILKKEFHKQNFYLLDFNHQLCRSYVYLKKIFPKSNHILPNNFLTKKKTNFENSFIYVPIRDFKRLENIKFDLVTNFFSFGEMKKEFFNFYYNSKIINSSKVIYLVNRFVSSPFFEQTYDTDINVLNYLKHNFKVKYFDVFPIHHYYTFTRELFGRNSKRPISSPYFEKILIKRKNAKKF